MMNAANEVPVEAFSKKRLRLRHLGSIETILASAASSGRTHAPCQFWKWTP